MESNMGPKDKLIRIVAAVVIAALYFTDQITGTAALILGLLGIVFVLTSALGFCPLYAPFKFSTKKTTERV